MDREKPLPRRIKVQMHRLVEAAEADMAKQRKALYIGGKTEIRFQKNGKKS